MDVSTQNILHDRYGSLSSDIWEAVLEPNNPVFYLDRKIGQKLHNVLTNIANSNDSQLHICPVMKAKMTKSACAKMLLSRRQECFDNCDCPIALSGLDGGLRLWRSLKQKHSESTLTKTSKKRKRSRK